MLKFFIPILLLGISLTLPAQELKPIKQYIYEVKTGENKHYDLIITVYQEQPDLIFSWKTSEENVRHGKFTISENARKTSGTMLYSFENGDVQLKDKTAMWVSDKVFNDLKKGSVTLDLGEGVETYSLTGKEQLETLVSGKKEKIKVLHGSNGKGTEIWIIDDGKNPLLFKMNRGGSIFLKEII